MKSIPLKKQKPAKVIINQPKKKHYKSFSKGLEDLTKAVFYLVTDINNILILLIIFTGLGALAIAYGDISEVLIKITHAIYEIIKALDIVINGIIKAANSGGSAINDVSSAVSSTFGGSKHVHPVPAVKDFSIEDRLGAAFKTIINPKHVCAAFKNGKHGLFFLIKAGNNHGLCAFTRYSWSNEWLRNTLLYLFSALMNDPSPEGENCIASAAQWTCFWLYAKNTWILILFILFIILLLIITRKSVILILEGLLIMTTYIFVHIVDACEEIIHGNRPNPFACHARLSKIYTHPHTYLQLDTNKKVS